MENLNRPFERVTRMPWRRLAKLAVTALSLALLGSAGLSGAAAQDSVSGGNSGTGIFGPNWPFPDGGELVVDDWPFPNIPAPGSGISIGGGGSSGGDINVGGSSGGTITTGGSGGGISIGGGSSGSGSGGGSGSGSYGG